MPVTLTLEVVYFMGAGHYNNGYGAALKTGVENATGDIVLFIDADARQKANDIPRLLESMEEYDMVVGKKTERMVSSKIKLY